MSVSYTMGSTKPLIIVILLSIYIQNIVLGDEIKPGNDLLKKPYALATRDRDLRGFLEQMKNAAEQIKKRALASWNYLKRLAEGTRANNLNWVNSAIQYAIKLEKSLTDEVLNWVDGLKNVIIGILGAGAEVEECVIDEAATILTELTEILNTALTCLIMQLRYMQPITGKQEKNMVNDTLFIADLDRKLDACKADKENYEECLKTVGHLVSEDIEKKYKEIQNTNIELRSLADNTRASLVGCVVQSVDDLVSLLISELMNILNCVTRRRAIN